MFENLPPAPPCPTTLPTQGMSGFHFGPMPDAPISFLGWADYDNPGWGPTQGVGFLIRKELLTGKRPLLYYTDDDGLPDKNSCRKMLKLICQYSSGITHVRYRKGTVLFRLNASAIKKTVRLSKKEVPAETFGGYMFLLPKAGEFSCTLGQIRMGRKIPLHKDSFCMK